LPEAVDGPIYSTLQWRKADNTHLTPPLADEVGWVHFGDGAFAAQSGRDRSVVAPAIYRVGQAFFVTTLGFHFPVKASLFGA
jgi:hypothetical protein